MISISDRCAEEVITLLGFLNEVARDVPGNRAANMRRRGALIIRTINKKKRNGKQRYSDSAGE